MRRFDIIISGAGMVGSIAAVAALKAGFSVALIEANELPHISEDSPREMRVSAISAGHIRYLTSLGITANLLEKRMQAYTDMQVWDNRSHGQIHFGADFSQQACLGYLLENNNLVQAACKTLEKSPQCTQFVQKQITTFANQTNQVRLELNDGTPIKGKLLIACEGRNSAIRQQSCIAIQQHDYQQKGLVAYITLAQAPQHTALQAFNHGGPIGILPMSDKVFSIVWSVPIEACEHWLKCSIVDFEQGVQAAIGKDFGTVKLISPRVGFPLSQLYAEKYFHNRVVLSGDSAHGVHPLAGQGVNLGIGDIQQLMNLLNPSNIKETDSLHLALRKYQRTRIAKVQETSEMMSFLHYLFKDDKYFKKPLRNFGLNLLDKLPLKKWLMQQADCMSPHDL